MHILSIGIKKALYYDLLRFIDRYINRFIIFILYIYDLWLGNYLRRRKKHKSNKKVLIIHIFEIGNVVLSYNSVCRIVEKYGSENVIFLTSKKNASVVEFFEIVDKKNILCLDCKSIGTLFISFIKSIVKINIFKVDISFDFDLFVYGTEIISYLSGAGERVGFYADNVLWRRKLYTKKVLFTVSNHVSMNFLKLSEAEGIIKNKCSLDKLRRIVENKLERKSYSFLDNKNVIMLQPCVDVRIGNRHWPIEYYFSLIEKLLCNKLCDVCVLVGKNCNHIEYRQGLKGVINFINDTNIEELFMLLKKVKILVSHDSGLVHLASVLSVPTIVFFGPENEERFAPLNDNAFIFNKKLRCSPCLSLFNHRKPSCKDNKCLKAIGVNDVFEQIKKMTDKLDK